MQHNASLDNIKLSEIRKMFGLAQGVKDLISFGIGEPSATTPENVIEEAKKALDMGYTHYTANHGLLSLRETIVEKLKRDNRIDATPDDVFVTIGGAEAIFLSLMGSVNPGDEVIILDPAFGVYEIHTHIARGIPVRVPLRESNGFHLDPTELEAAITPKTRVLVFNTPQNPTGVVFTLPELEAIARIAVKHDLIVVADEVYEKIIFDGRTHNSIATLPGMEERTITIYSFSKTYAMTGWRVGYLVAKNEELKTAMFKIHQNVVACAHAASQIACIEAIKGAGGWVESTVRAYQESRDELVSGLARIPGIHCVKPEGTFYAMVNIGGLKVPADELATYLLKEHRVLVTPGGGFGPGGNGYLRCSFPIPKETVAAGVERIAKGIEAFMASR